MKKIHSPDNRIYKLVNSLHTRKYRDKLGIYLIEGTHALTEAVKNDVLLEHVIFREDYKDAEILAESLQVKHEPLVMIEALFNKLSQTENSQGVLAVAVKKHYTADQFFQLVGVKNVVILDRLQDLGNIGTIIRTADAAGYGGVISLKGTGDIYAPKVVRAATGSVFRLPVLFVDTPQEMVRHCKNYHKRLAASCINADLQYDEAGIDKEIALIIGNEGGGISEALLEAADIKINIPMQGNIDSLNAAVAAGILMYESVRKSI